MLVRVLYNPIKGHLIGKWIIPVLTSRYTSILQNVWLVRLKWDICDII